MRDAVSYHCGPTELISAGDKEQCLPGSHCTHRGEAREPGYLSSNSQQPEEEGCWGWREGPGINYLALASCERAQWTATDRTSHQAKSRCWRVEVGVHCSGECRGQPHGARLHVPHWQSEHEF